MSKLEFTFDLSLTILLYSETSKKLACFHFMAVGPALKKTHF